MKSENESLSPEEPKPETFSCTSSILQLYECQNCNFEAELSVVLHNHVTVVHKQRKILNEMLRKYYCENCEFQTWSLLVLTKHFTNCKGFDSAEWLNCELCSYKTRWKFELKNHVLVDHSDQEDGDWLECEQCLSDSQPEDTENTKRFVWVKCSQCPFKTISNSGLKVHVSHCHQDLSIFKWAQCDQCSFKTKWETTLKRHMNNMHKMNEFEWFNCYKCAFRVVQKHHLTAHIIAEHLNVENIAGLLWFKCEHCSYKTTSDESLKIHITSHLSSANISYETTCLKTRISDHQLSAKSNNKNSYKRTCLNKTRISGHRSSENKFNNKSSHKTSSNTCSRTFSGHQSSTNNSNGDEGDLKNQILAKWGKIKANWANGES